MTKRFMPTVLLALLLTASACQPVASTPVTPTPSTQLTTQPTPPQAFPTTIPTAIPAFPTLVPTPISPLVTPTRSPVSDLGLKRQGGTLGDIWTLADVRVGVHEDRVRIVLEMAEASDHAPWYEIIEVDNAAVPFPTGHDPTWGIARIDLVVSDLYAYEFPLGERLPITPPENPVVTRVGTYPTFSDSQLGFSVGLTAPAAYEVYELTDPVRLVVDVLY